MENENNLPNDIESMTPEQAEVEINETLTAAAKDPSHPYTDGNNPQHRKAVDKMSKLYEIKNRNTTTQDVFEQTIESVMQEDAEKKEVMQQKLFEQATEEVEKLVELGFVEVDLPEVLEDFHVRGLTEQRLAAEGNFKELVPMLEKDLTTLKAPAENLNAFRYFSQLENISPETKQEIADVIVRDIYEANKTQSEQRQNILKKISGQKAG